MNAQRAGLGRRRARIRIRQSTPQPRDTPDGVNMRTLQHSSAVSVVERSLDAYFEHRVNEKNKLVIKFFEPSVRTDRS